MAIAMRETLVRLGRGQFVQSVAVIAGGSAIAQAIPVLLTPFLTRLYSPADMGVLALYLAFIGFATNATTLGYSQAIVSARSDDEAADLTMISAIVVLPVAIIGAALLWLLTARSWLGYGELPVITVLAMAISLVLTGLYSTIRYWLIRTNGFGTISRATIGQSAGRIGTQIALGVVRGGWGGLILGEIAGRGFGLRRMWRESWSAVSTRALPLNGTRLRDVAGEYRKFPLFTAPSAVLNSMALVLPVPLVSSHFGVDAAGQFSIATRVLLLPMALIGTSVGDVFHNRIAALSREQPERALRFFLTVAGSLLFLGMLPMLLVALFGGRLWATVLGSEWETAGRIAAAITPWALMQLAVSPVSRVVAVYQGQELKFVYDVLGLLSIVGVLTLGAQRGWSLIETCTMLGWSQAIVYTVYFLLLLRIVERRRMVNRVS